MNNEIALIMIVFVAVMSMGLVIGWALDNIESKIDTILEELKSKK